MGRAVPSDVGGAPRSHSGHRGVTAKSGRRRFLWSVSIGAAVVAIPYMWVLTVDWNRGPSLLRKEIPTGYTENFYDLQARALLAGHKKVPKDPLGIEAWIHNGHAFTYFGLFPSLLRIPCTPCNPFTGWSTHSIVAVVRMAGDRNLRGRRSSGV